MSAPTAIKREAGTALACKKKSNAHRINHKVIDKVLIGDTK
ncbi:hypothetical protein [Undibacterium sp. TJN19]